MKHQPEVQHWSHLDAAVSALSDGRLRVAEFPRSAAEDLQDPAKPNGGSGLRGLQAARSIAPDELLMSIPLELMLRGAHSPQRLPTSLPSTFRSSEQLRHLRLALYRLLTEDAAGLTVAAEAAAAIRACLSTGDATTADHAAAAVERRLRLRAETHALDGRLGHSGRLLVDRLAGLADDWLAVFPKGLDRRLWLACCQLVNTRVVHIPGLNQIALVPYFDLFNHSPLVSVETAFDPGSRRFTLTTSVGYSPGDQVFINYGCHSNLTLLVEYDFVLGPAPNQQDCVPVDIVALSPLAVSGCGHITDFLEQLAGLGMMGPPPTSVLSNPTLQLKYFHLSIDGPSYYLLLLLMTLSGTDRSLSEVVQSMSEDQLAACLRDRLRTLYGELKSALIRDRNLFAQLRTTPESKGAAEDCLMDNCIRLLDIWCDIVAALMDGAA